MKKKSHNDETIMVSSHDIHLDGDYAEWIAEVKHRYRSAQIKAAVKVNAEKLLFNWQLGRDLVQKKAEERWGGGVVEQVSLDLRREFPNSNNFSARNLWYMKQWYMFYTGNLEKLKQLVSEMLPPKEYERQLQQNDDEGAEKLKQSVSELPLPFACVPWGHHIRIVQHSQSIEEALFYVGYTIKEGISREVLSRVMKDDIYNKRGKAPNNFPQHLTPQIALLAQQVVKENYDFGFATVKHEIYDEDEMEKAPYDNPTIGLLICSNMNRSDVQWSFKGITTPIGVATYNNIRIKDVLPTKKQLKERVELLQKEMRKTKMLMSKNK